MAYLPDKAGAEAKRNEVKDSHLANIKNLLSGGTISELIYSNLSIWFSNALIKSAVTLSSTLTRSTSRSSSRPWSAP